MAAAITVTIIKTTNGFVVTQSDNPQVINPNQVASVTNCADETAAGTAISALMTAAFTPSSGS